MGTSSTWIPSQAPPGPGPGLLVPPPAATSGLVLFEGGRGGGRQPVVVSLMNAIPLGNSIPSLCNFGKTEGGKSTLFPNEKHLWKYNAPLCQSQEPGELGWGWRGREGGMKRLGPGPWREA